MLPLDKWLAIFAVAETIVATLRASSRLAHMIQSGSVGIMEGPLIEPPKANESSALWEFSNAFRHCVTLDLDRDDYNVEYEINDMYLQGARLSPQSKQYSLSPSRGYGTQAEEDVDEEIEFLMQKVDHFGERHGRSGGSDRTRKRRSGKIDSVVLPLTRAHANPGSGSAPWSLWQQGPRSSRKQEEEIEIPEQVDPLESDFYLTLSTVKLLGTYRKESSTTNQPRVAQLTAYAPETFAQLRSQFGISEDSFRKSVLESGPYVSFSSNSKGAARAGGVFFFTRDGAYMIKTIKSDEVPALLGMLPRYFSFMKRNARKSLLTRYCGMYEVTFRDDGDEKPYTFVVMNSVFPAEASRSLSERFDLKGSTIGRECSIEERESKGRRAVLQDLDLSREVELIRSLQRRGRYSKSQGYGINIGPSAKAAILSQLRRDVDFLVACKVMDYSLLVGVEKQSPSLDAMDLHMVDRARDGQFRLQLMNRHGAAATMLSLMIAPWRHLLSPPVFLARKALSLAARMLSLSRPYYGSGDTVVDAGPLARIPGQRMGCPAVYYFGLIDFLQPFNTKKSLEHRIKSVLYESNTASCVPPEEYGERFLAFLDEHMV